MKTHVMNLDKQYFDFVKNQKKTYELRVFDEKRQNISLMDKIKFKNGDREMLVNAQKLLLFDDFYSALSCVGFSNAIPNANSIEDAVKIYESINGSLGNYKELAKNYGVIAIKIN